MTTTDTSQRDKLAESFGSFLDIVPIVNRLVAETRPPRDPLSLLDLGLKAGAHAGQLGLDAGGFNGKWAKRLIDRYGCRMVVLDIAQSALREAAQIGLTTVAGDVQAMSLPSAAFDFVWCRDMLECVADPAATLREFWRVLKPVGCVMLYAAFSTPDFEPKELAQLIRAVDQPAWWDQVSAPVEKAITSAGFEIDLREVISPEYTEHALRGQDPDLISEMALLGRLRRERARFEAEMGTMWYERWVGWMQWGLYLLLGKIQTIAWVLRKPARS